jgi:hypothetical protein
MTDVFLSSYDDGSIHDYLMFIKKKKITKCNYESSRHNVTGKINNLFIYFCINANKMTNFYCHIIKL